MHRNQFWMLTPKYKNLLINGDFADGTNGWATQNCNLSVLDGVLTAANTNTLYFRVFNAAAILAGRKYYFSASGLSFDPNETKTITSGNSASALVQTLATFSGSAKDSFILQPTLNAAGLRLNFAGTAITISGVILIDLTATFGAGNEPDLAWCNANIPPRIAY